MNFARYFKIITQVTFLPLGFSSSYAKHTSTVGSLNGKTVVIADNHYTQTGSAVTSPQGKVDITAKTFDITAAHNTTTADNVTKTKQSGLTVVVSVPVIDAVLTVADSASTVGKSKNSRVNAIAIWEHWKSIGGPNVK